MTPSSSSAWPVHHAQLPGWSSEDGDEREAEPGHADDDEQVRGAAGQREGADGAQRDDEVEAHADDEEADGDAAARLGQLGTTAGLANAADAGDRDEAEERADGDRRHAQAVRAPQRGERRQGEHRAADGQRGAAREGDDPVGAEEHAGRRQAVDDEQQRHRAERAAGDQRPAVAAPDAGDRQGDAGERRDRRADGHDHEMSDAGDGRLAARERVQGSGRHGGAACDEEQMRPETAAEKPVHVPCDRPRAGPLDDPSAECGRPSPAWRKSVTETGVEPAAAEVAEWLGRFEEALAAGDAAAAAELFADDSFWRDLVAFTWNLKTRRGPGRRHGRCSTARSRTSQPRGWRTTEPPTEADGVTEAWIAFETEVGRGSGHPAPARRQGVDAADHALRAQGPRGAARRRPPAGRRARRRAATARRWLERREREARGARLRRRSPTVVIVGGGQGGIALGARLRQLGVPTIIVERNARPGDSVAQALQVALPARPGLVRPPARTSSSPRTGRCSRRRTRSATGSRCTRG